MGAIRGHKCMVGDHKLQGEGVIVNNQRHIDFIRKVHGDFNPSYAICENCYKGIVRIYNDKYRRAMELHKRKSLSTSSLDCKTSTSLHESSANSINKLVSKTPRSEQLQSQLSSRTPANTSISSSSSESAILSPTLVQVIVNNVIDSNSSNTHNSTQSSLYQGPSTSADATAIATSRRKRKLPAYMQQAAGADIMEEDDDEPVLSPNALNGTRLPHIQPIPKRRQFVHANQDIMDIYLAGTTGG